MSLTHASAKNLWKTLVGLLSSPFGDECGMQRALALVNDTIKPNPDAKTIVNSVYTYGNNEIEQEIISEKNAESIENQSENVSKTSPPPSGDRKSVYYGLSPLHFVVGNLPSDNVIPLMKALVAAGADVNRQLGKKAFSSAGAGLEHGGQGSEAASASEDGSGEVGCDDIDAGITPLHLACQYISVDVAHTLLHELKADPNIAGGYFRCPPLHLSLLDEDALLMLKLFLGGLRRKNRDEDEWEFIPYDEAAASSSSSSSKNFVRGIDLTAQDKEGNTLLALAEDQGDDECIEYLKTFYKKAGLLEDGDSEAEADE